ncbi:hypothetical protein HG531_013284 [Fusarium graminearum]|nr:hypothetical protein HG531_013284 [Fusarium graminearum]
MLPLGLQSVHPFLQGLLVQKLDDKVLNTWVSLPPDLHAVAAFEYDDSVHAMQEELAKLLHLVALPVFHTAGEILDSFVQKITVDCFIGFRQNPFSGFATSGQVHLDLVILSFLVKILMVRRTLDLVENLVGDLGGLALVCDKGLVNIDQSILVVDKRSSPSLVQSRHGVCRFDSNEEPALEIENCIDVEEDLMQGIAGNLALLFERLFQVVQILEILDVFSLGVDKFPNNMISLLHACLNEFEDGDLGLLSFISATGVVDLELLIRSQSIVDEKQRVSGAEEVP